MRDFLEVFVPAFFIMVLVIALSLLLANFAKEYSCNRYEDATERETKWVFLNDCYIKTDNGWLTRDEYSAVIIAREGLSKNRARDWK